jgi:hypothetical protein
MMRTISGRSLAKRSKEGDSAFSRHRHVAHDDGEGRIVVHRGCGFRRPGGRDDGKSFSESSRQSGEQPLVVIDEHHSIARRRRGPPGFFEVGQPA